MRDSPPYRAIPFRDSIAEGGIARVFPVFIGYCSSIAEIPLFWGGGGVRTSTSHALQGGGKGSEKGKEVSHPIGHVETALKRGVITEIVSRYRAIRGHYGSWLPQDLVMRSKWIFHEDGNGEKLTVKKWWIFGADFFTVWCRVFHGLRRLFTVYKL